MMFQEVPVMGVSKEEVVVVKIRGINHINKNIFATAVQFVL